MGLQQSSEFTWHFQDPESEDSWNHRISHREGTMHINYSNLHILFIRKEISWFGLQCKQDTLNHLQGRTAIIHLISLYQASPVSQPLCYILEMPTVTKTNVPLQSLLGGLTQNMGAWHTLSHAWLDLVLRITCPYRHDYPFWMRQAWEISSNLPKIIKKAYKRQNLDSDIPNSFPMSSNSHSSVLSNISELPLMETQWEVFQQAIENDWGPHFPNKKWGMCGLL